jgi:hypothetical protein
VVVVASTVDVVSVGSAALSPESPHAADSMIRMSRGIKGVRCGIRTSAKLFDQEVGLTELVEQNRHCAGVSRRAQAKRSGGLDVADA